VRAGDVGWSAGLGILAVFYAVLGGGGRAQAACLTAGARRLILHWPREVFASSRVGTESWSPFRGPF